MLQDTKSRRFSKWIPNSVEKILSDDRNNVSAEGSDLVRYIEENEELKQKVASLLEETKANVEEISYLSKKLAKEEEECRGYREEALK